MSGIISRCQWDADIGQFVAAFKGIDLDTLHISSAESLRSYTQLFCGVDPLEGQEDVVLDIVAALADVETADEVDSDCIADGINDDDDGVGFDRTATSDNLGLDAGEAGSASPRAKRFKSNGEDGAGSPSDASLASAVAAVESLRTQDNRVGLAEDGANNGAKAAPVGLRSQVALEIGSKSTAAKATAPGANVQESRGSAFTAGAATAVGSAASPVSSAEPVAKKARKDALDNDPWPCPIPDVLQEWLDDNEAKLADAIAKDVQGTPLAWAKTVDPEVLGQVGLSSVQFQAAFLTFLAAKRRNGVVIDVDKGVSPRFWLQRYHDVIVELYRQRPDITAADLVRALRHNSSESLSEMNFVSSTLRKLLAEIRPLASQGEGKTEESNDKSATAAAQQNRPLKGPPKDDLVPKDDKAAKGDAAPAAPQEPRASKATPKHKKAASPSQKEVPKPDSKSASRPAREEGPVPAFAMGTDAFCVAAAKRHQLPALLATDDKSGASWRWLAEHHSEVVEILLRDASLGAEELIQEVSGASTKEVAGAYTNFHDVLVRYKSELSSAKVLRPASRCSAWLRDHKAQILSKPGASFQTLWKELGDTDFVEAGRQFSNSLEGTG
mmetsp:Transcript_59800/g.160074  ORF Transcript_59800/g.160074 Transcript_59800/m.160074 type:complete len:612 (+) Transcript_59800:58-1893(+)